MSDLSGRGTHWVEKGSSIPVRGNKAGESLQVAIVGGGIGGLATALALHKIGIHADVYEQAPMIQPVGAGIQLSPNIVRILYRLGLAEHLRENAILADERELLRWKDGTVLQSEPFRKSADSTEDPPYYFVHRADLINGLLEALPRQQVHLSKRCLSINERHDGVKVTFEDGEQTKADVLVGADGIHSTVRHKLLGPEHPTFSGLCAYRGIVDWDRTPEMMRRPVVSIWMGPYRHFVNYPISAGKLVNFVAVVPADDWTVESWTAEGSVEEAVAEFDGWHPAVRELVRGVNDIKRWGLYDRKPLESWTSGRIALLGDSAHPMLPFFAQGAGQAIEDAVTVAGCIKEESQTNLSAALRRYEKIRKTRASHVQLLSQKRGDFFRMPDGKEQRQRDRKLAESNAAADNAWLYEHDAGQILQAQ